MHQEVQDGAVVVSTSSTSDNGLTPIHIGSYAIGLDGGAGRVTENTLADIRSFSRERSIESVLAEGDEDYAVGAADAVH